MLTRFSIILLLVGLSATFLLAQTDPANQQPEPATPTPISCQPDDLVNRQLELTALLKPFADDLEVDSQQALGILYEVGTAYQEMALACGYIPENVGELRVGHDVERIMNVVETLTGDPFRGQLLYNSIDTTSTGSLLGCSGCHFDGVNAPITEYTWDRVVNERLTLDQFKDYSPEQYLVESIVLPGEFLAPGWTLNTMPPIFGDILSYQDLADIIAYLHNQTAD
jgi:hypothetical protein